MREPDGRHRVRVLVVDVLHSPEAEAVLLGRRRNNGSGVRLARVLVGVLAEREALEGEDVAGG